MAQKQEKKKNPAISKKYLRPRWKFLSQDWRGTLYIEQHSVSALAQKFGTPLYVFVEREIRENLREFKLAFPYARLRPQYAGKINSNIEIMQICRQEGFELDASSVGEIVLGLLSDFSPGQITLTNLYKSEQDILFAAKLGIKAITADSMEELARMARVGKRAGLKIKTFIRVNPALKLGNYSTMEHQYGIPYSYAKKAITFAVKNRHLELIGLHFHGAYIENPLVYTAAAQKILGLAKFAQNLGAHIKYIDLGGGFPFDYGDKRFFKPQDMGPKFIESFEKLLQKHKLPKPFLIFEPGKVITANAGVGIVEVISNKKVGKKNIAVTDGSTYAFLPDPMIYKQYYDILPATKMNKPRTHSYIIAGRSCDSIDKLGVNRYLPKLEEEDLLAIMDCGAYSNVLSSNFNTLRRAPMVLVKMDGTLKLIRRRDRYSEMFAPELDVLKVAAPKEMRELYNFYRVNFAKFWGSGTNAERKKEDKTST
ncbi:MAG: diaminopimelate decarboxylase [archaeon]|nr:diaminopimelate decarboxylase [archaeon]